MRDRLLTAACGLMLAVALGVPATAQAAVSRPGPAEGTITPAGSAAVDYPCAHLDSLGSHVGNGQYAGWDPSRRGIYFGVDAAHAIPYCFVDYGGGEFKIVEEINGRLSDDCLDLAAGTEDSCTADAEAEDDPAFWMTYPDGTYHSQTKWLLWPVYGGGCMYDYKQDPIVGATCYTNDVYEQFVWDALPSPSSDWWQGG